MTSEKKSTHETFAFFYFKVLFFKKPMSSSSPSASNSAAMGESNLRPRLSVRDLMYRRSKDYARRVYLAHLTSTHQPIPRPSRALTAKVDAVHSRLLKKYPFRLLL